MIVPADVAETLGDPPQGKVRAAPSSDQGNGEKVAAQDQEET
jgi:hypothetical protein